MRSSYRIRLLCRLSTILCPLLLCAVLYGGRMLQGQASANPPIRVVRVGHGSLEGLRVSITASSDACRVIKHLPPQGVALPSDDYLAKFVLIEEEELFDGQRYAKFTTERLIWPDASSGCALTVFTARHADSYLSCVSRIYGSTPLLGEQVDLNNPSSAPPTIEEEPHHPSKCNEKPLATNSTGIPHVDAGGTKCFWSGDLVALQMAKFIHTPQGPKTGFDICLYEDLPTYYYKGVGEPVVLMSKVFGEPAGGTVIEQTMEVTLDMDLRSFSATQAIPKSRFERPAIEAFLNQPMKASL